MAFRLSDNLRKIGLIGFAAFLANQTLHLLVLLINGDASYFLCQFDCNWYAAIVESGYMTTPSAHVRGDAANWAFFPLFPILSSLVHSVTGLGAHAANIVTAKLLFLPAIWAYLTFQQRYAPQIPLWIGAVLVALNPASIYANVGYTETLFLLLTCLALIAIRDDRPLWAGAMGALLTATRAVGVGVGLTFAVYALRKVATDPKANGGKLIFAGLMIPLGLAAYMLYLHDHIGDAMAFSHIQRAWDREIGNPVEILIQAFDGRPYDRHMAWFAIFSLIMSGYLAARQEIGLALFLAFVTLIPLSTGVDSMGRYVMLQPPMLLGLGLLIGPRRWLYPVLAIFVLGYIGMINAWLEGYNFVI